MTPLQKRIALLVHQGRSIYEIAELIRPKVSPRQVRRHIEQMGAMLEYPGPARAKIIQWVAQQEAK